jgi:hypothetical protein
MKKLIAKILEFFGDFRSEKINLTLIDHYRAYDAITVIRMFSRVEAVIAENDRNHFLLIVTRRNLKKMMEWFKLFEAEIQETRFPYEYRIR